MDPIEVLGNEHGLIRAFVDLLAEAVDLLGVGRRPPAEFFGRCVEFASGFADDFHHRKEEMVMFRRLAERRDGAIDGQIEALRFQHDEGRAFIREIDSALSGYAAGDPHAIEKVRENVSAYISMLEHHIHTEDHVFFPMARRVLSREDMREILAEFDHERRRAGPDALEHYHKITLDLEAMLGALP